MNFSLRLLERSDLEWLRCLRNECRAAFFYQGIITAEAQERWYQAQRWGDEHWVITHPESNQRVGYFSIVEPNPDLPVFPTDGRRLRYLSTLLVDADYRGKGAIQQVRVVLDVVSTVYVGYPRVDNLASVRSCEKMGFVTRGVYEHPTYGRMFILWKDR